MNSPLRSQPRPAYLSGTWLDASELRLAVDDYAVAMGVSVAERLRTFNGEVFRASDHLERLHRSLDIVGWDAARLVAQVSNVIDEYAVRIGPLRDEGDDWSIAVFISPGQSAAAVEPTVCVYGFPLPFAGWADQFEHGVPLAISTVRQTPTSCWPAELKCRSRMHYYLADRDATSRFPGARPVLLDQEGYVTESSTANLVLYEEDRGLVTPRLSDVLPGVSQLNLFELAESLGVARCEEHVAPERLANADEVFLTSTSVCMLPVASVDGRPIGSGTPGPQYARFLRAWSEQVGVDIAAQAQRFANR
ncbi:MAG: aminotransferase class IV family protein [Planctomycetales bacterium]|nr:aminotransferase class IV family protein [Planctomycetales bacterium]